MNRSPMLVPLILLLAACAGAGATEPARPTLAARSAVEAEPVPSVDHHKHLMGPAVAGLADGDPLLPTIDLPADLARLLHDRASRWNDRSALAELYAEDSAMLSEARGGWLRGRSAAADYMSRRFGRPYALTPVHLVRRGRVAQISGYYTRGDPGAVQHIGYFHLTALQDGQGRWLITGEVPRFPVRSANEVVTADQLIADLDAAGVARAVVLSEAFWADGPLLVAADPYSLVVAENDWTARQVQRFPDRLIAFCSFNPVADHALTELERCAGNATFRGLKFSFAMSGVDLADADHVARVRAVFAAANRHRLPIVVHLRGGSDYDARHVEIFLAQVMSSAPDIPVQVAHLWGGEQYSPAALAALAEAVEGGRPEARSLYFDVAEIVAEVAGTEDRQAQAELARRIRQIGVERILFGSDGAPPLRSWRWLRVNLPLTDTEFAAIARNVAPYLR